MCFAANGGFEHSFVDNPSSMVFVNASLEEVRPGICRDLLMGLRTRGTLKDFSRHLRNLFEKPNISQVLKGAKNSWDLHL